MTISTATDRARVAFLDLAAQRDEIDEEVERGFARIIRDTAFIGGAEVAAFEDEFSAYCEVDHCVGVANGTDAIEAVLRGLGIGHGDEVVLPANTFIATAGAVHRAGARPVLVDCDDDHLLIDPRLIRPALTDRTRAVIGVDLYGQRAAFDDIGAAVAGSDVAVVEDAAQAQGARRDGRAIGSDVGAAATSFYPGKNLGAYGDAGAVITQDASLAARIRAIANHGGTAKYEHRVPGMNSRLDALQAVVLRAKLRRLEGWNEARRSAADRYDQLLDGNPAVRLTQPARGNVHVWHLYVVRVADRDRVLARLQESGVEAGIHYPAPIHLTPAYEWLGYRTGDFPVSEAASRSMISLPMHPHLTADDQARVVELLLEATA